MPREKTMQHGSRAADPRPEPKFPQPSQQHDFTGTVVALNPGARTLSVREPASPQRELTFALADTRIRSGSVVKTQADLAPGQKVRVHYIDYGSEHRAQRVDLLGSR